MEHLNRVEQQVERAWGNARWFKLYRFKKHKLRQLLIVNDQVGADAMRFMKKHLTRAKRRLSKALLRQESE